MATIESIKAKIQGLIEKANRTTSRADTQLTPAVDALIAGYGSGGGGGGYIDVTELPTENINEDAAYRLTEEKETSLTLWMAAYMEGAEINMPLEDFFTMAGMNSTLTLTVVSTLPDIMTRTIPGDNIYNCYILESTGIAYISYDGTSATAVPLGEEMLAPGADKGWINSADDIVIDTSTDNASLYTIRPGTQLVPKGVYAYSDGWYELEKTLETTEKPREPRVYATTSDGEVVDFAEESGYEIPFVDALPVENGWYVLNATGLMYYVDNGQANLFPGTNCGWVDSLEEIDTSKPDCLYSLRGSKTDVIYKVGENGTTNEVYIHENDEWQGFTKGGSGGGAELNIAYGDTAPEDTTKLWVKTSEPSGVVVDKNIDYEGNDTETITTLTETFVEKTNGMTCASFGNKIYLLGGDTSKTAIRCFDVTDKVTTTLPEILPWNVWWTTSTAVGSKIYLFGGPCGSYSADFIVFDMETEKVTPMQNMPVQRSAAGCAAVGTSIYMLGGADYNDGYTNKILCYDIDDNVFTTVPKQLPTSLYSNTCVSVGSKIYSFGGWATSPSGASNRIIAFDTETQDITELSPMPISAYYIAASCFDNKIYLFGGASSSSKRFNTVYAFDVSTESIISQPLGCVLPSKQHSISNASIGSKTYLFCGNAGSNTDTISIFEPVNLTYFVEANKLHLITDLSNTFYIINGESTKVKVGVIKALKGNTDGIGEKVEMALHKDGVWSSI